MRNAILFVTGHHTAAMHGSMVAYTRHAAMQPGRSPGPGASFYQPGSDWFSDAERALANL